MLRPEAGESFALREEMRCDLDCWRAGSIRAAAERSETSWSAPSFCALVGITAMQLADEPPRAQGAKEEVALP